jgi:hypothetical protein
MRQNRTISYLVLTTERGYRLKFPLALNALILSLLLSAQHLMSSQNLATVHIVGKPPVFLSFFQLRIHLLKILNQILRLVYYFPQMLALGASREFKLPLKLIFRPIRCKWVFTIDSIDLLGGT